VENTLHFPELLRLIDERSTAFRAAIAAAPSLDAPVPTCPGWTLSDLVRHLGEGRYVWAATVAAGPADAKAAPTDIPAVPEDREAISAWLAASTQALLDALHKAGPDRGCWTWWGRSQSPETTGAVARHQLHEIAMHTYDAQLAAGAAQPMPVEVALDAVEEFLVTVGATTIPWPHKPGAVDFHAAEGVSWRQAVSADGVVITRLPVPGDAQVPPTTTLRGTAEELALVLYGRGPVESLTVDGSLELITLLQEWDPEE
jgi:uncharacterized protein (TIGR03083 family)